MYILNVLNKITKSYITKVESFNSRKFDNTNINYIKEKLTHGISFLTEEDDWTWLKNSR